MTALRMGLVGLGMMGRHHARVIRRLAGVEFVGAADPDGDRYASIDSSVPVVRTVEELLQIGLDACVVAVPTAAHAPIALALAEARVASLVEKPLAGDMATARRVTEQFERAGVLGAVGHIERYNPAIQQLRARLEANELGDIYQIATRRQGPFPNRISDVGVILDLASHDLDMSAWITGGMYESVSAHTAHRSGRPHEDLVAVVGMLSQGTVTNHLVNWLSPFKERVVTVTGERGCFVADTLTADLTWYQNASIPTEWDALARFRGVAEGDMTRFAIAKPEPLALELGAFRDAVVGRPGVEIVSMREALATVATAEAARAAAAEARTVRVELN